MAMPTTLVRKMAKMAMSLRWDAACPSRHVDPPPETAVVQPAMAGEEVTVGMLGGSASRGDG